MYYFSIIRHCGQYLGNVTFNISVHHLGLLLRNTTSLRLQFFNGVRCSAHSRVDAYKQYWFNKFKSEGVSEPRESIEAILSHVVSKDFFYPCRQDRPLSKDEIELLERLCECRIARMPLQYIVGEWQFRRLNLSLSPPVFIPRPETETLVDLILKRLSKTSGRVNILEVGCDSGAISLALAQENSKVICTAIDQCDLACNVARKNSSSLNLNDRVKIWWARLTDDAEITACSPTSKFADEFPKKFDIVVSNPPYVPNHDLFHLQPEILLYEDLKALDGGKDGLKVILPLIKFASSVLNPSLVNDSEGTLFIEVDPSHPALIQNWLCDEKNSKLRLQLKNIHLDLFGKERFVELIKI